MLPFYVMSKLTKSQKEKLKLQAEKHVDELSYDGICDLVPRGEFWWKAQSEHGLYQMQRSRAIEIVANRLISALESD
jgi:hypothetical protein